MVVANGTARDQVTDDLIVVARVLEDTPSLARVLSDDTAPLPGRVGLVDSAFGSTSQAARADIKSALDQSWDTPGQFVRHLRDLATSAAWEWAFDTGDMHQAIDEVFQFGQWLMARPDLRRALTDRRVGVAQREALAAKVTATLTPPAAAVIRVVVGSDRATLDERVRVALEMGVARAGAKLAVVIVARHLDDTQEKRLSQALERRYETPVIVEEIVDPTVLGGVRVECGADVIDATMGSRLEAARRAIA